MAGDVTIETERLILREFRRDDWERVHDTRQIPRGAPCRKNWG